MTATHLQPESQGDRGFVKMPMLHSRGTRIVVGESSLADEPALWFTVWNHEGMESFALLTADVAWQLKEQIETLLANHYQGDARPERTSS